MSKSPALMKVALIFLSLLSVFLFYFLSEEKKKRIICKEHPEYVYDTVYLNDATKCDYIILKRRESKDSFQFGFSSSEHLSADGQKSVLKAEPIRREDAIRFVKNYNEIYNPDLSNTSFIDFESDVLMKYFIDVRAREKTFNFIRVYFANYGTVAAPPQRETKNSTIIVAVKDDGEYFGIDAYDYGGLRPPPSNYDDLSRMGATILVGAINESQTIPPTEAGRRVIQRIQTAVKADSLTNQKQKK